MVSYCPLKDKPDPTKDKQYPYNTNIFPIKLKDPNRIVYRYDVQVEKEVNVYDEETGTRQLKRIGVNKFVPNETRLRRYKLVELAVRAVVRKYNLLPEYGMYLNDGAALLFTSRSLDAQINEEFELFLNDLLEADELDDAVARVLVQITPTFSNHTMRMSDVSGILRHEDQDGTIRIFFELLTSQNVVDRDLYSLFGGGAMFRTDESVPIAYGHERREGLKKTFTICEGQNRGGTAAAIAINPIQGTFVKPQSVIASLCERFGWRNPSEADWTRPGVVHAAYSYLDNVRVTVVPTLNVPTGVRVGRKNFMIDGFVTNYDEEAKRNVVITYSELRARGRYLSEESLAKRYLHVPQLDNWPFVFRSRRRLDTSESVRTVHSLEHLVIQPMQRVPLHRQLSDPPVPMEPKERVKKMFEGTRRLNLGPENEQLEQFGASVVLQPVRGVGRVLQRPKVHFAENAQPTFNDAVSFRTKQLKYLHPAVIHHIRVGYSNLQPGEENKLNMLFSSLRETLNFKGCVVTDCSSVRITNDFTLEMAVAECAKVRDSVEKEKRRKLMYIFMLVDPKAVKSHDELKLYERRHGVPTQHVTWETMQRMKDSAVSENIALKMNVKCGGFNYRVEPTPPGIPLWMPGGCESTLVIGVDVCHPPPLSRKERDAGLVGEPSVVGFGCNISTRYSSPKSSSADYSYQRFIGDFSYQTPKTETVLDEILVEKTQWAMERFEKYRGRLPERIVYVRDGVSEGESSNVKDEASVIVDAASAWARSPTREKKLEKESIRDYAPQMILIVCTKRHNKRFYSKVGDNVEPGFVVDDVVTTPLYPEFFMCSHKPLQGTAKVTSYRMLRNDCDAPMVAIQSLMNALTFQHQVCTSAISLPEPLYQADEWAKRGQNLFRTSKRLAHEAAAREPTGEKRREMEKLANTENWSWWTKRLAYRYSDRLEMLRANA